MEKNSSCNLTTNDICFSPSLNSLPSLSSSKNYLSRDNLQTYECEIIHDQQKRDLISKSEFSIVEEEVLSPSISCDSYINIQEDTLSSRISDKSSIAVFSRVSENQTDTPCIHIISQKNERLEENNILASEVGDYVCRSETARQNYIAQIRKEPTTIVITRRGSTNSLTAVGNCARFRGGGSDLENPATAKRSSRSVAEEDSKTPLTVWERDSEGRLSSTSGESVAARSSADTVTKRKRNTDSYFRRLSSRLSDGGRRTRTSKSRGSSPRSKKKIDMTDKRLRSKIDKSLTPSDPRYFGPGRNSAYEGEGEENANKSEGSNKREGSRRSFFSRSKPRSTSRSRSKSKSQSPQPKRVSSKTGKKPKPGSEALYVPEPASKPYSVESCPKKTSSDMDQCCQPPKPIDKAGCCCCDVPPFQNQQIQTDPSGSGCCCCDAPIPPFQNQQIQTDSSGPVCCSCQTPIPPFQNQEIQTDSPRSGCCCCSMPPVKPKTCQRDKSRERPEENKPNRKNVFSVKSDVRSTIAYEAFVESYGSEVPPGSPKPAINPKPLGTEEPTGGGPQNNSPRKPMESKENMQPTTGDAVRVYCSNCGCGLAKPKVPKAPGADVSKTIVQPEEASPNADGVSCDHCGCAASAGQPGNSPGAALPKDENVSQVLWALAKVTVFNDGTRNFEILESTSIPPGHYLMRGNEEFMLVPVNR